MSLPFRQLLRHLSLGDSLIHPSCNFCFHLKQMILLLKLAFELIVIMELCAYMNKDQS